MDAKRPQNEEPETTKQKEDPEIIKQKEDPEIINQNEEPRILAPNEELEIIIHPAPIESFLPRYSPTPSLVTYDVEVTSDLIFEKGNCSGCALLLADYVQVEGTEIDLFFPVDKVELRMVVFRDPQNYPIAPLVIATFHRGEEKWNVMKRLSQGCFRFFVYRRQVYLGLKSDFSFFFDKLCLRLSLFPREIFAEPVSRRNIEDPEDLSGAFPLLVDRTSAPETIIFGRREKDMAMRLFRLGSLGEEVEILFSSQQTYQVSTSPSWNKRSAAEEISLDAEGRFWLHKYRELEEESLLTVLAPDFAPLLCARMAPGLRILESEGKIYATFHQNREISNHSRSATKLNYHLLELVTRGENPVLNLTINKSNDK